MGTFFPFLTNYVLFDPSYMPDQFLYLLRAQDTRALRFDESWSRSAQFAGHFLGAIPFPAVESVRSLGIINRTLFILVFFYLYKKGRLDTTTQAFLLLYPSMGIYTSIALRDNLIFLAMLLSTFFIIERRYVYSLPFLALLYMIKVQNFFIMLIFSFVFVLATDKSGRMGIRQVVFSLSFLISLIFVFAPWAIPIINKNRKDLWIEDGGLISEVTYISGSFDFLRQVLFGWIDFLLKPFPWEANSILQLIQSVENIFVLSFLVYFTLRLRKIDRSSVVLWLFFLIMSLGIYSLVVANFGTAARYRFTFIGVFVFGIGHALKREAINRNELYDSKVR